VQLNFPGDLPQYGQNAQRGFYFVLSILPGQVVVQNELLKIISLNKKNNINNYQKKVVNIKNLEITQNSPQLWVSVIMQQSLTTAYATLCENTIKICITK